MAHFELLNQVGAGAYGSVWKARDTILDRVIALKIPRFGQLSAQNIDFFFRDARAAAQLRHPSIVSVHEVGRDGDTVFIASDFIEGANLREWLSVGGLLVRDAAELVLKVAEAVHHAHQRGVVHRDLKPANILLDLEGNPHVTDFGVAKRETGEATITAEGQLIGTAQYMSPEQAAGKGHQADARSDVYSLGVILFELLTGEVPFRGEMRMLVVQILNDEPPRLRKFNARVPRDLETICLKCLEKDPHRRYATAQELADDLRRYLDGEPIYARPVGKLNRGWRWAKRKPMVAGLSGVLLATLLSIAVVAPAVAIHQAQLRGLADEALTHQVKATNAAERSEAARADQLWRSLLDQARATRISGRPGRHFKSLEALEKGLAIVRNRRVPESEYLLDFRNEAIAALAVSDLALAQRWQGFPSSADAVDLQWGTINVDAKQTRYSRSDANGNISVRLISKDKELVSLPGFNLPVLGSLFSPDGRFLAVQYWNRRGDQPMVFKVWNLDSGIVHLTLPFVVRNIAFNFSPNGRLLAVGTVDLKAGSSALPSAGHSGSVLVYDLENPQTPIQQFEAELPEQLSFHPNDDRLAVTNDTPANFVEIYDLKTQESLARLEQSGTTRGIDWSPDGRLLAVGCHWDIFVWDVERREHMTLPGHLNQVTYVAFNHRGDRLASRSWDYSVRLWDMDTRRQLINTSGGSEWAPLAFSPDDTRLSFVRDGAEVAMLNVAAGRELRRLVIPESENSVSNSDTPYRTMDFSPDGRWLVAGDEEGVHLWDLNSSGDATSLPIRLSRMYYQQPVKVSFATDGFALLAASREGLERWPFRIDSASSQLHIGPPEMVAKNIVNFFSTSEDHVLGVPRSGGDAVVLHTHTGKAKATVSHPDLTTAVVDSHDGWLATAGWREPDVKVWDVKSGELLRTVPAVSPAFVSLSPDKTLLLIGTPDEFRGVDTHTWQTRFALPRMHAAGVSGHSVFSDNGQLIAVRSSFSTLQLIDAQRGEPISELRPPHEERLGYFCFSHNGDCIAVRYGTSNAIEIWDLREIRRRLAELRLNWDLPQYEPATRQQTAPVKVITDTGPKA